MADEPDRISIKKTDRPIYDEILGNSDLKVRSNIDIFLLALVIGFKKGQRISIKGNKDGYVLTYTIKDEDRILMNAIAIHETKNEEVIQNQKEVFEIVEEYAHTGISFLREMVFDKERGSFLKKFESYLRDMLQQK